MRPNLHLMTPQKIHIISIQTQQPCLRSINHRFISLCHLLSFRFLCCHCLFCRHFLCVLRCVFCGPAISICEPHPYICVSVLICLYICLYLSFVPLFIYFYLKTVSSRLSFVCPSLLPNVWLLHVCALDSTGVS